MMAASTAARFHGRGKNGWDERAKEIPPANCFSERIDRRAALWLHGGIFSSFLGAPGLDFETWESTNSMMILYPDKGIST
jgi:hypothetical protein